jgi:hypothetical protein
VTGGNERITDAPRVFACNQDTHHHPNPCPSSSRP